jgi:hypothetical protein
LPPEKNLRVEKIIRLAILLGNSRFLGRKRGLEERLRLVAGFDEVTVANNCNKARWQVERED